MRVRGDRLGGLLPRIDHGVNIRSTNSFSRKTRVTRWLDNCASPHRERGFFMICCPLVRIPGPTDTRTTISTSFGVTIVEKRIGRRLAPTSKMRRVPRVAIGAAPSSKSVTRNLRDDDLGLHWGSAGTALRVAQRPSLPDGIVESFVPAATRLGRSDGCTSKAGKPGGIRPLGIPTVRNRVVMAAAKKGPNGMWIGAERTRQQ
jgi:hypothetical protein